MKKIIYLLIAVLLFGGCTPTQTEDNPIQELTVPVVTIEKAKETEPTETLSSSELIEAEVPAIGENRNRMVESVGESYRDLENLSEQERNKLGEFSIEKCYFKMKNIPKEYEAVYVSLWEVGFFAFYEIANSNETLKFHWWAEKKPSEYINELEKDEDITVIRKNGIDYYCEFREMVKEPTDTTELSYKYDGEIRWVEDGKCFYIDINSNTLIDESILELCELEKYTIN